MRIALVTWEGHKLSWTAPAFRALGHEVWIASDLEQVKAADREADLLIFQHKAAMLDECDLEKAASKRKAFWVTWNGDLVMLEPEKMLCEQTTVMNPGGGLSAWARQMRVMDAVAVKERRVNGRDCLAEYRSLGINAFWMDQACPSWMPAVEYEGIPEWDVLIPGQWQADWLQRRHDALSLLSEGFVVAWAGTPGGDGLPPGCLALPFADPVRELPALVAKSACVLGVDYTHAIDGYWSDRSWLLMGMGAAYIRRPTGCFPPGPYAQFCTDDELFEQVQTFRQHLNKRAMLGASARAWVMANHTYEKRCEQFLKAIEAMR